MSHKLVQPDEYIPPELAGLRQPITPEQFEEICRNHSELRLELTSTGELIVMPPTGSETSVRNADLIIQLGVWTKKDGTGICFESSNVFALPSGARRSPDAAWAKREKWESLTKRQKQGFAPICPDFVVELRSPTDRLPQLRKKMVEYIENGASLGWLIDPSEFRVYVYKPHHEVVILESPKTVSADPLLPGFTLSLIDIWQSD